MLPTLSNYLCRISCTSVVSCCSATRSNSSYGYTAQSSVRVVLAPVAETDSEDVGSEECLPMLYPMLISPAPVSRYLHMSHRYRLRACIALITYCNPVTVRPKLDALSPIAAHFVPVVLPVRSSITYSYHLYPSCTTRRTISNSRYTIQYGRVCTQPHSHLVYCTAW